VWLFSLTLQRSAKSIETNELFQLNKCVTCQNQLDDFRTPGSLGFAFLALYQNQTHTTSEKTFTPKERGKLWTDTKDAVHNAINQTRASKQLALNRKCNGTYMCIGLL